MVAAKKVFLFETFEKCFCDFLKSSLKPIGCYGVTNARGPSTQQTASRFLSNSLLTLTGSNVAQGKL